MWWERRKRLCLYLVGACSVVEESQLTHTKPPGPFVCFFKINLFIYFWLHWVFIAAHGLSLVVLSGGYSLLPFEGFSWRWLLLLQSKGSRRAGFSSCGTRAWLLRGMWDLPGPGLKPVSPALAGGFLTTVPPGKSPPPGPILRKSRKGRERYGSQDLERVGR